MGRRRIKIEKIEDKIKRQVTFTKRRQGLFKKAHVLGKKCGMQVAIITISQAGNIFAFGHPTVNFVVQRYEEAKKAQFSSEKRDDDGDEDDLDETEDRPDDDDDQNKFDHASKKRDYDQLQVQEVQDLPDDDDQKKNRSDQMVLALPLRHSILKSKMMPLLRDHVPRVEELELHELEQLMVQMEKMKKMVLDRANQIKIQEEHC